MWELCVLAKWDGACVLVFCMLFNRKLTNAISFLLLEMEIQSKSMRECDAEMLGTESSTVKLIKKNFIYTFMESMDQLVWYVCSVANKSYLSIPESIDGGWGAM